MCVERVILKKHPNFVCLNKMKTILAERKVSNLIRYCIFLKMVFQHRNLYFFSSKKNSLLLFLTCVLVYMYICM